MSISSQEVSKKVFSYLKEHGKHVSTALFIIGFIIDFTYLPAVEHTLTPYIGIFYTIGLGFSLFARSFLLTLAKGDVFGNKVSNLLSLFLAFFSGSILSYIFVLYYRSSYIAGAFPFFLFALFVIIANEYIKTKKYRTYLDICIFYFVVTALSVFLLPFLFHSVSSFVFLFSLVFAGTVSALYAHALLHVLTKNLLQKKIVYSLVLWAPFAFAFLYYTNSVPPLPLSITSATIYHDLQKVGSDYKVLEEVKTRVSTTYHVKEGRPLYFFTTIFAPSLISAPIDHIWEKYDENTSSWKIMTSASYPLIGGRKEGYRGYTISNDTTPGKWRVSVYLDRKRLLGRHYFTIVSEDPKELKMIVR